MHRGNGRDLSCRHSERREDGERLWGGGGGGGGASVCVSSNEKEGTPSLTKSQQLERGRRRWRKRKIIEGKGTFILRLRPRVGGGRRTQPPQHPRPETPPKTKTKTPPHWRVPGIATSESMQSHTIFRSAISRLLWEGKFYKEKEEGRRKEEEGHTEGGGGNPEV